MQAIQPAVSKAVPAVQIAPRDHGIDGGIPDIYTADEMRTTLMSQTPGTMSSMSQVQSTAASAKVPSKSTASQ
uniref:Uncharacterized protein n=1 Tax=Romanomermis culicivorax TaxID=13658 RepID=A0A915IEW6_ROMCU